jgi:ferredoxin/flavodoxin---NADP+ reductase
MVDWVAGEVVERVDWTDKLVSLKIKANISPYKAGQYASIALDIDGERVTRPFSYVNSPAENIHEIYFILVDGGLLSTQLYKLQKGSPIWVGDKSHGFFVMDEVPDADVLWMLATGTALGPFISMLKTEVPWTRFKKLILAHGVRTVAELSYKNVLAEFAQQYPDQFVQAPFVSREKYPGGFEGRIPAAIADGRLEAAAGVTLTAENSQVMLCGNPEMVKDTTELLLARGLEKNMRRKPGHVTVERYWN